MKRLIFILLCSLGVFSAAAQNIIRPKIAGPNGLWVNSYNGVLFFGQTDIETQNTAMPMQLRFYYNSSANETNYGYGLGFSLGYEMRYEEDEQGNVTIETGDGRTDVYKKYGDDYESPAGVFSRLTYADGKYVLTEKTGEKYEFADANHKKMTAQEDRHGNRTTLTYSNDSLLTRIQDAVGHTINLEYSNQLLARSTASFLNGSISYAYDSKKRLIKRTDAMGFSTSYDYDKENHLDEITDANGNKTLITYNASGMVSRMKTAVSDKSIRYDGDKTVFIDYTKPKNLYSYYRWDDKGRVIEKVGMCCGVQSKMEYDEENNVIRRTDANGNSTTYTYDDRGNMLTMTDSKGNTERYTYDAVFNNPTSYMDKNGNNYRFDYNSKGDLTAISGPEGFSNSFTYDEHGWPLTATDGNGNVTQTTYNTDGTTAQVMNAAGYTSRFSYDVCGNMVTATDAMGQQTTYAYDYNNRILSQTNALGNATTLSYDKIGNIVRVKNAKNQITAYTYDALGHVLTQTDPMGGVYCFTYDGNGNVITVTDPLGRQQTMTYNERNKLMSQTNAADEITSFDYDAKGNLTTVFLSNGNILNYEYDVNGQLEIVSDNIGLIATYTYDNNGNKLTVTDGLDRTMTYTYDGLNRLVSETLPSGSTTNYAYDANSNLLSVTDAHGRITTYTYSSRNQQLSQTDALNAKTQFEYDANGNLVKATDANGNSTSYAYDAVGQNTSVSFANGLSLQYAYDELGRVVESKDMAGNTFRYVYDNLGRILSKTYPDNTQDKYTYDAVGQMLSAINKNATVRFTYDAAGRVLLETLNGKTIAYGYDVAGRKRSFVYPSGMRVEEYLDVRNQITEIMQNGALAAAMQYNLAGQKTSLSYGNGVTTNYAYNENGFLLAIQDDHNILSLAMTYDAVGNITKRQDLLKNERTETYGYDAISQLVSFKRGTVVNNTYHFDLLGNRMKVVENGMTTNYTANNMNAYTSVSCKLSFTPHYDDNGNMLNDDKHSYAYDWNNRQVGVDDGVVTLKYDALGRRIFKNGITYFYVGDQMVEKYADGQIASSYLYGNSIDETLQMTKGNAVYYYHTNHLGSTMALSDANGTLVERVEYDSYGLPTFLDAAGNTIAQSAVGNDILFTGREYDAESGTYYYRARSMNPKVGRFMQKDPLMCIYQCNLLEYAGSNPIIKVDKLGLYPKKTYLTSANSNLIMTNVPGPVMTSVPGPVMTSGTGTVITSLPGSVLTNSYSPISTNVTQYDINSRYGLSGAQSNFSSSDLVSVFFDGLENAPDNIGIRRSSWIPYWKDYSHSWSNQYGFTISGKPLRSIGSGVGIGLQVLDVYTTFNREFESESDFWDTFTDWLVSYVGGSIGAELGAAVCVELGPGAIVCAMAGSIIGSSVTNYHLNDCEVFNENALVRSWTGHGHRAW